MKYKLNAYFAVLLITIIGSGAAIIIVRTAFANTFAATYIAGGKTNQTLFKELTR